MIGNYSATVDELWEPAARYLPVLTPEEQRAGLVLFRELTRGEPVADAELAQALGMPLNAVEALVKDSTLASYVHTDAGNRIQGFFGLAVTPTPHQLTIRGRRLWTWCAYDTLFIPELLDETVEIETRDPETGQPINLTVSPHRVETADPTGIVASIVGPQMWDHTSAARLIASACHFMFFFTSRASGERWQAKHSETVLLSLDEAFAYAKRSNALSFGAELARRRVDAA